MTLTTMIPKDFCEYLRLRLRISDIIRKNMMLTKRGHEYVGLCPFHNEKTPSFTVNDAKRFYHCFGCGAHGDLIKFVAETRNIPYKDSAISIARENSIEIPQFTEKQRRLYAEAECLLGLVEEACVFFQSNLNQTVRIYLHQRGITDDMIRDFGLGYAPGKGKLLLYFKQKSVKTELLIKAGLAGQRDNGTVYEIFNGRIIFPIRNTLSHVVGFGGRVLDNSLPKYINSPETKLFNKGEILYCENFAASAARKKDRIILVEGYTDVIALQSKGYKETVAALGTAVTTRHLLKLWSFATEIIVCLDGDTAGVNAAKKLINEALPHVSHDNRISFVTLKDGMDPDTFISKMGCAKFEQVLKEKKELSRQILENELKIADLSSPENKTSLESSLYNYIQKIKDTSLAKNFQRFFTEEIKKLSSKYYRYKSVPLAKEQSRVETLERSILSLLMRYPELLMNPTVLDELKRVDFATSNFATFFDWICDAVSHHDCITTEYLLKLAENAGFSNASALSFNTEFPFLDQSVQNIAKASLVLSLLTKQLILERLSKEYYDSARSVLSSSQALSQYYLQEIRKTSKAAEDIVELLS